MNISGSFRHRVKLVHAIYIDISFDDYGQGS